MVKAIIGGILIIATVNANAVSFQQAQSIYNRLGGLSGPRLTYSPSSKFNAYNNGSQIILMRGLMVRTNTQEMAFVLGHELSHQRYGTGWEGEFGADRMGVGIANRGGFNGCAGAKGFFRKANQGPSKTHPSSKDRMKRLPC